MNAIFNVPEILTQAHKLKKENKIGEAIALLEDINEKVEDINVVRVLVSFLMDSLNYKRVADLPGSKKFAARNYVLANSLQDGNLSSTKAVCLKGHKPLNNVAFIAMIKDEEDVIFFNLVWHYWLGLRKFFIIDNLSRDNTLHNVKKFEQLFEDTEVFIVHDPVVGYYQSKKTTAACRFAMTFWSDLDWLLLTDADEFLCPAKPLYSLLEKIPKTVDGILLPKSFYNLFPGESAEDDDYFFKRIQHRTPITHNSTKVIMRAEPEFIVGQGNHDLYFEDNSEVVNYICNLDLTYREYRMRSHGHYKKKVINGGLAVAAAKAQGFVKVGGGHWEALYDLYQKQGDIGLRRHLENFIQNESVQTSILDPLPIDLVVEKLGLSKQISNMSKPSLELHAESSDVALHHVSIVNKHDGQLFNERMDLFFIDRLPAATRIELSTFKGDVGGIALAKTGISNILGISLKTADGNVDGLINIVSPVIERQFPNNPFAANARFVFKNIKLKKNSVIQVIVNFEDKKSIVVAELKT